MFNKTSGHDTATEAPNGRAPRAPRGRSRRAGSNSVKVNMTNELQKEFSGPSETYVGNTKALASELKELLSNQEPWSREVEFQRQRVRHQYMALIFKSTNYSSREEPRVGQYPRKSYATEALNLLWLDTSHSLINVYRQKLSSIDKLLAENRQASKSSNRHRRGSAHQSSHPSDIGPVARRKVLQKFRSFLGSEDDFWKYLINRLITQHPLDGVKRCLMALKISDSEPSLGIFSEESPMGQPATLKKQHLSDEENCGELRNEGDSSRDFKKKNVLEGTLLLHKSLICFGDLTRYRELYASPNQNPNNQAASKFQSNAARSYGRFRENKGSSERDWSKTYECYNQARLLMPNNGNPSNQLAVLSSYIPDILSSAYHYFLALCVKNPFPTARQNLKMTFTKALSKWLPETHANLTRLQPKGEVNTSDSRTTRNNPSDFEADFVALHAMLYTQNFELFNQTNSKVCLNLVNCLQNRALLPELILKMVVIGMSEVWHFRVNNYQVEQRERQLVSKDKSRGGAADLALDTEVLATVHLLQFSTSILKVVGTELESIGDSAPEVDLSQNISAVLRRILPALRIISKWILSGHLDHIDRILKRIGPKFYTTNANAKELEKSMKNFSRAYEKFLQLLRRYFPIQLLPKLDDSLVLEEDLDLDGFLPIKKGIAKSRILCRSNDHSAQMKQNFFSSVLPKAVHPNEEHLMRLADNQRDSTLISSKFKHTNVVRELKSDFQTISSGSQRDVREPENAESSSSNHDKVGNFQPIEDRNEGTDDENVCWIDDEDPVEMAMRAVVAHQMYNDCLSGSDFDELNQTAEGHDNYEICDGDDGDDEVLHHPNSSSEPTSGKQNCGEAKKCFVDETQSLAKPSLEGPQESGHLKTAADLLASMTSQVSIIPDRSSAPPPFNASSCTPVSPTGWSSVAMITQTPLFQTSRTPVGTPGEQTRRTPSISLPKPPDGHPSFNIWSNTPRSFSRPSMSSPNVADKSSGSNRLSMNEDLKFTQHSTAVGFKIPRQNSIAHLADWSISAVIVEKSQEQVDTTTKQNFFEKNWTGPSG